MKAAQADFLIPWDTLPYSNHLLRTHLGKGEPNDPHARNLITGKKPNYGKKRSNIIPKYLASKNLNYSDFVFLFCVRVFVFLICLASFFGLVLDVWWGICCSGFGGIYLGICLCLWISWGG